MDDGVRGAAAMLDVPKQAVHVVLPLDRLHLGVVEAPSVLADHVAVSFVPGEVLQEVRPIPFLNLKRK